MAEVKKHVLEFANKVSRKKMGSKDGITEKDPEYLILEPVVTEEMGEVALALEFRKHQTVQQVANICKKSEERTGELLEALAMAGVAFVNTENGEDVYWYETWVPGIMEMMVNNLENVKKYPQIAEAFNNYGLAKGAKSTGMFPIGVGLMRVIPIETALSGETRHASYEEVSKFLNDHTVFSVSDCACRTVRESMGEGCGHLKEDMCIQLGHAAEYYIRTGRGRAITREEAFDIIKRAEENGLMHQIPNTEGADTTHAICNCCGCSCLSLRGANMFMNSDMIRSNFVAQINTDNCVACGACVENCPVNALQLGQKICSTQPFVEKIEHAETPRNTVWGEDRWNADYRINRKDVVETGTSPCKSNCPAHIAVQGYIKLASQGRYTEALELIKKENPFPAICGRICPKKCESACSRGDLDNPVAIDDIKKFLAEQDLNEKRRFIPRKRHAYGKKIAVIGAGPSGLSCAYYLAIDGYEVTVFEKQKVLGGMMVLGIPSFRLEKNVVHAEIEILKELGVTFKTGIEVGKDISIATLRKQGFEAFYIAVGAQGGRALGVEGEDAEGVYSGIEFLREVNLGKQLQLGRKVIVIGGGNVAIDVARTAVRAGGEEVSLYCLEARSEMPALEEEIEEAEAEAIQIQNSWGPKRILVENGKVCGVEFKKCISVFDENKRFSPKFDEQETLTVPADSVLLSIGQSIEWGNLLEGSSVTFKPNNTAIADSFTLQSGEPDIFIGGDALTGPRFAIDAIALGKEASISIHRFVQPGQSLVFGRDRREYTALDTASLELGGYDRVPRQKAENKHEKHLTFSDTRGILTEEQMKKETERCLGCGATIVDQFVCVGCGQCTTQCKFDAISLVRVYDKEGVTFDKLKPVVMKNVIKRKVKMTAQKVHDAVFPG